MGRGQEQGIPTPTADAVHASFGTYLDNMVTLMEATGGQSGVLDPFATGLATNGLVMCFGSEHFFADMERAGVNHRSPFGLELNTLTDDMMLVLYPRTIYPPTEDTKSMAKEEEVEVRAEGSQAMLYMLDGFIEGSQNTPNITANLIFASHLVGGLLEASYPIERDNTSQEFLDLVRGGMTKVRQFAGALKPEERAQLKGRVAQVCDLNDDGVDQWADRYVEFDAQILKPHGLFTPGMFTDVDGRASFAPLIHKEYLRVSARNLPEINGPAEDAPPAPWREFGRNMWDRNSKLFGRYEAPTSNGGALRVDFRLDSLHMPAIYGFFDKIEITQVSEGQIRQQIVLGQEVDPEKEMIAGMMMFSGDGEKAEEAIKAMHAIFPIIISGDFDFSEPEARQLLESLAAEHGTKPDIRKPLVDILSFSKEGTLTRVADSTDQSGQSL